MNTEAKVKKTENMNSYMNNYIKKRYDNNPVYWRMYKNTLNIKKKYAVPEEWQDNYKHSLHHIIKMKEMIDELPEGVFETFLTEYKSMVFERI